MRLRHVKNIEEKILDYAHIIIQHPEQYKGRWNELFKNQKPIRLEIGTGKGKFIIEHALKNPEYNYIGCELNSSIIYKAAKSINNISNLLLINYDASRLKECFAENEIEKIYLNFSDPWPKTRHEKRRLTSDVFIDIYRHILINEGFVEFKTDNRKLFEYSIMKFNELKCDIMDLSLDLHNPSNVLKDLIITTEYEDKFTSLGQVIYYVKVRLK